MPGFIPFFALFWSILGVIASKFYLLAENWMNLDNFSTPSINWLIGNINKSIDFQLILLTERKIASCIWLAFDNFTFFEMHTYVFHQSLGLLLFLRVDNLIFISKTFHYFLPLRKTIWKEFLPLWTRHSFLWPTLVEVTKFERQKSEYNFFFGLEA